MTGYDSYRVLVPQETYAAAVLTEHDFIDREVSLAFLQSDGGKKAIVALYVDGIVDM